MSGGDGGDGERRTGEVRWEESRKIHAASSFLMSFFFLCEVALNQIRP